MHGIAIMHFCMARWQGVNIQHISLDKQGISAFYCCSPFNLTLYVRFPYQHHINSVFILPINGIFPRQITGKFCHGLNDCLFCTYKSISLDVNLNHFSKIKCFNIISTIKTSYIMNTGMPYIMQHCTVIFRHICY